MITQIKALPRVLSFSEARYYIFSAIFISLAVAMPWLTHQFGMAGQIFLPMHIFVLSAGFLFGWRTGLLVGVASPLLSYSLTQMPIMALLPQVVLELAVYGLVIGFLREKRINIWVSLLIAMIAGRLTRILFIAALVPQISPLQFMQISLPGVILQIALMPLIVHLVQKFIPQKDNA